VTARQNQSHARAVGLPRAVGQTLVLMLVAASGCNASIKADAKMRAELNERNEPTEDFDEPLASSPRGPTRTAESAGDAAAPALLGARPDLKLAPGKQSTTCRCLAVAAGTPSDAAFSWEGEAPVIDPMTELVIAFSSAGTGCTDEPKDSLGASYWGYQTSGQDIVVVVECARSGRPVTTGAIIPRPAQDGRVYVRPADASVPYAKAGRDKDGQSACVVNISGS
jgi:hypothetical protein